MHREHSIPITLALSGQTLAAVVRRFLGNMSWSDTRRLIAGRRVRINGIPCLDDARRLKNGDIIEVVSEAKVAPPPEVRIVYCDSDIVVVDKPAGLQTVRRAEERGWSEERKRRQPVVQEIVVSMLSSQKMVREKTFRVRDVHRLDRDTSGLMLFALSGRAEEELVRRFASHEIQRVYWAVVMGKLTEARTIESWLVRDRGDGIRGSIIGAERPSDARCAITHVKPIEQLGDQYTIIECRLETGRTHQIRIHLAEIGHMLCGEKVYVRNVPGAPVVEDRSEAPRQALHSAELELAHPVTRDRLRFESQWPADLKQWIGRLRVRTSVR